MNQVKKYSAEVERGSAREREVGAVSLSSFSAVFYFNFLGQLQARLLQRQPEVFVHLLQPRESIKHKPQKRTVAAAALA